MVNVELLGELDDDVVDRHIGQRLKVLRVNKKISVQILASVCDVTTQQYLKYENAEARIVPAKLVKLGIVLGVDPAYFFEGLKEGEAGAILSADVPQSDERFSQSVLEIGVLVQSIKSPDTRRQLKVLIQALAAQG
jgi:transcriptional regulator with XRE-family HTH domain